jgi:hypothetical protein
MSIVKKIMTFFVGITLVGIAEAKQQTSNDITSFMITNEDTVRGEIKIKQRAGNDSPYLILGCNTESDDFYVLVGNLNRKDYTGKKFSVITSFKEKSYKDEFIPVIRNDVFYLAKSTNQEKDNQLFVYQLLKTNQAILDFGKNTVFYFNARNNSKLVDYMNIIVSHCGIKF